MCIGSQTISEHIGFRNDELFTCIEKKNFELFLLFIVLIWYIKAYY